MLQQNWEKRQKQASTLTINKKANETLANVTISKAVDIDVMLTFTFNWL